MSGPQATNRFVGLDVHKREITACILDERGEVLQTKRFLLTRARLEHFAKTTLQTTDQVALEATTNCWAVAERLQPHVARVVTTCRASGIRINKRRRCGN